MRFAVLVGYGLAASAGALNIWPQPVSFMSSGTASACISSAVEFTLVDSASDAAVRALLESAITRFRATAFPHAESDGGSAAPVCNKKVSTIQVSISSPDTSLVLETQEGYRLDLASGGRGSSINSTTLFGSLHALETLSQLVSFNFTDQVRLPATVRHVSCRVSVRSLGAAPSRAAPPPPLAGSMPSLPTDIAPPLPRPTDSKPRCRYASTTPHAFRTGRVFPCLAATARRRPTPPHP
jgi:hypothetical protein